MHLPLRPVSVSYTHLDVYKRQAYICITDRFAADEGEMNKLLEFVRGGNDVFVSARYISSTVDEFLRCGSNSPDFFTNYGGEQEDLKTRFTLNTPPFTDTVHYQYPGKTFHSYFSYVDKSTTQAVSYTHLDVYKRQN